VYLIEAIDSTRSKGLLAIKCDIDCRHFEAYFPEFSLQVLHFAAVHNATWRDIISN